VTEFRDKRVLLVEDEALIAVAFKRVLQRNGFNTLGPFATSDAAIAAAESTPPDVAVLDYNLLDGETSVAVAQWLAERDIPFLFLTGGDIDATAGPTIPQAPILPKPIAIPELIDTVAALLREHG